MSARRLLRARSSISLPILIALLLSSRELEAREPRDTPVITIAVDATEAPRRILHAHLVIPAGPGVLSLSYPKWIPGEHGPSGPLTDVAGLRITAEGQALTWERDLVDLYAVRCVVPPGDREVEVDLDFLSTTSPQGFSAAASATEQLAVVSWNQLLLYPSGARSDDLTYAATLRLPSGWKYGTALPVSSESPGEVRFAPVSLSTLVDSPVILGAHFRRIPLSPGDGPPAVIDVACDGEAGLETKPELDSAFRRLVAEAPALFGARHYRTYHFLLTLSDHVAHFGLEHHESSDNRAAERMLVDDPIRTATAYLLPHEFVHSWNGKYRRPADLATPDFQAPMKTELLWVYEGLTQYLGFVLATRSGLASPQTSRERLALITAGLNNHPGRTWRPLIDTAVEAQLLYNAPKEWASWRRGVDFYDEGLLIWLEADALIRRQTGGRRSLDDFCHLFFGGESGPPRVETYTFDDVVSAMNAVHPYDWRAYFEERLHATSPSAPVGGIEGGGWRLAYADSLSGFLKALEERDKFVDEFCSIGIRVATESGSIEDVVPGSPAGKAGLAPGMKLVAVNGRHWSKEILRDAIRATRGSAETLEILADNGEFYRTFALDYHEGSRYPALERDRSKIDILSRILAPRTPKGEAGPGGKPRG